MAFVPRKHGWLLHQHDCVVSTLETRSPTSVGGGRGISRIIGGSPPATREQDTTPPFWRNEMIGETLRKEQIVPDHDSRCTPLVDLEGDWIATTGAPTNDRYGLADLEEVQIAGRWILVAHGTDSSAAWWHEADEEWVDGKPH